MPVNHDELLSWLDEAEKHEFDVSGETAGAASAAIRALQAENEKLREQWEKFAGFEGGMHEMRAKLISFSLGIEDQSTTKQVAAIETLRADLARVTAERDEARGGLASIADALNTALRENHHDAGQVRSVEWQDIRTGVEYLAYYVHAPLRAQLARVTEERDGLLTLNRNNANVSERVSNDLRADLARVTAENERLRGESDRVWNTALADVAAAKVSREEARADLARVTAESSRARHERDMALEQLAALAPRAEAMTMLEKWLRGGKGRVVAEICPDDLCGGWHLTLRDHEQGERGRFFVKDGQESIASAIRAAVGKAGG